MKTRFFFIQQWTAFLLLLLMVFPVFAIGNDVKSKGKALSEDQKILHVLNRLGFGARPGDVEKVKSVGLQRYIDQQLDPMSIDDAVAETKVKDLDIFSMSTAELFAKYPNPGALLRQLEGGRAAQAKTQNNAAMTEEGSAEMSQAQQRERRQKITELY